MQTNANFRKILSLRIQDEVPTWRKELQQLPEGKLSNFTRERTVLAGLQLPLRLPRVEPPSTSSATSSEKQVTSLTSQSVSATENLHKVPHIHEPDHAAFDVSHAHDVGRASEEPQSSTALTPAQDGASVYHNFTNNSMPKERVTCEPISNPAPGDTATLYSNADDVSKFTVKEPETVVNDAEHRNVAGKPLTIAKPSAIKPSMDTISQATSSAKSYKFVHWELPSTNKGPPRDGHTFSQVDPGPVRIGAEPGFAGLSRPKLPTATVSMGTLDAGLNQLYIDSNDDLAPNEQAPNLPQTSALEVPRRAALQTGLPDSHNDPQHEDKSLPGTVGSGRLPEVPNACGYNNPLNASTMDPAPPQVDLNTRNEQGGSILDKDVPGGDPGIDKPTTNVENSQFRPDGGKRKRSPDENRPLHDSSKTLMTSVGVAPSTTFPRKLHRRAVSSRSSDLQALANMLGIEANRPTKRTRSDASQKSPRAGPPPGSEIIILDDSSDEETPRRPPNK
ncbi:hypothetical protein K474DRAFT_1667472 [Panus rudis PR-1116 ss-1]|nr:hypothetical protein K474DRAFT_1667472 [Panus rudis PR-1116 ss-1]